MNKQQFSYCEPVTNGPVPPCRWHIRRLTKTGQHLGGGADTRSLCSREMGWDLSVEFPGLFLSRPDGQKIICTECAEEYRRLTEKEKE